MKYKSANRRYKQKARALSAEATAIRITRAFLHRLMKSWYDEITLDRIAEDAGVTVQTVVRRFGGKEGLLGKAVEMLGQQVNARRNVQPGCIDQIVDKVIEDYELTGDTIIRLLSLEPRQPALKRFLDFGRSEHREWVQKAFAEPLARLNPAERTRILDALIINTDVYTWKLLRRDMARNLTASATTMKSLIQGTLDQIPKQN